MPGLDNDQHQHIDANLKPSFQRKDAMARPDLAAIEAQLSDAIPDGHDAVEALHVLLQRYEWYEIGLRLIADDRTPEDRLRRLATAVLEGYNPTP